MNRFHSANQAGLLCGFGGALLLLAGIVLSPVNHVLLSILLLIGAVAVYVATVLRVAKGNWLDIRAAFSGVWLGTIGLAALRLAAYQEQWQVETWIALAAAYLAFYFGAGWGIAKGNKWYGMLQRKEKPIQMGRVYFRHSEDRLFAICVITTLIGLACFLINVAIKGFIPCFSSDVNAYRAFYTKFHVFAVAATGVSGLCFYCIKTQKLSWWKKVILLLCIFYLVFLFPTLVVSRGVFMVAALSLAATIFYLYDKKLVALILCLAIMLGVYVGVSQLRNYTSGQIQVFFSATEPTETEEPTEETKQTEETEETEETTESTQATEPVQSEVNVPIIQLPSNALFMYGYLTVSHDNLNEAVQNLKNYTYGARELAPFNVILRSSRLSEYILNGEHYQVNPYLNTTNLIGDFYYDLGVFGVAFFMCLWAFVFGLLQSFYENGKNIFVLLALGNAMTPVVLCFFASWMSQFNFWMFWGVALLLGIAASVHIHPRGHKK